jgi:hypothetical protein
MHLLTIITNMFQTFDFSFVECCVGNDTEGIEYPRKIKIMKYVNDKIIGT